MIELQLIEESPVVKHYSILDFKQGVDFYYFKAQVELIDSSNLMIRVFLSEDDYNYSYHWQDASDRLIIRWDNSPHHKNIFTHPHHKHTPDTIEPSKEVSLKDVLVFIEKHITP